MFCAGHVAAASLCSTLLFGCQVYDPTLLENVDSGAPMGCEPRHDPPPRPPPPDDGVDVGELGFAIKDVVFEQGGDLWKSIGYDLDGRCSVPPDPDVECVPPAPGAPPELDGVGGTDNVFGHRLFPLVQVTVPGLQASSRSFQERGNGSVLLRVTGWNGLADDFRVRVVATVTVFGTPANPDGSAPEVTITPDGPRLPSGALLPPPRWDGHDYFWARDDSFVGGDITRPLIVDDNAYVRGRVLVVNLPERTDFIFPGEDVGLLARLTDAVATGRISEDRARIDDVVVAGRWSRNDLLLTAESVGVCDGTPEHDIFQNQLDRIVDVRSRAGTGGAGVECDAISVGIAFSGFAAAYGGVAHGPDISDPCASGGSDGGATGSDGGGADAGM